MAECFVLFGNVTTSQYSRGQPKPAYFGEPILALEKQPQKVWNCINEFFWSKGKDWHEPIARKSNIFIFWPPKFGGTH